MDGPVDAAHCLGLAFGHRELPVPLRVGHGPDGLGLALGHQDGLLPYRLGGQDDRLPFALGPGDCRLAGALGLQDHGTPGPLGLHLLVHGVHHVGRRVDPLDLDADHPDAPLVGGVVEHLAHGDVDVVP